MSTKIEWYEWPHGGRGVPWRVNTAEFNALLLDGWEIVAVKESFTLLRRYIRPAYEGIRPASEGPNVPDLTSIEDFLGQARDSFLKGTEVTTLRAEVKELKSRLHNTSKQHEFEKEARIRYQDIVYAACTELDHALQRKGAAKATKTLANRDSVVSAIRSLRDERNAERNAVRSSSPCPVCKGNGEEASGVCYCGASMEGHALYDNHAATEMVRPCPQCKLGKTLTELQSVTGAYGKEGETALMVVERLYSERLLLMADLGKCKTRVELSEMLCENLLNALKQIQATPPNVMNPSMSVFKAWLQIQRIATEAIRVASQPDQT